MAKITKKTQVVLAVTDEISHSFDFLLLQTNEKRGSFWQNVTGKVEEEENFQEGALREAIEETALPKTKILEIIDLDLHFEFTDQRQRQVYEETFLIVLKEKWPLKLDPHEHQSWKWIQESDLKPEIVKYDSNFEALLCAQKILKEWRF